MPLRNARTGSGYAGRPIIRYSRSSANARGVCDRVTVITTVDSSGRFHGLTANSFNSVSLDPPLVLWSQAVKAKSHHVFYAAERFAVNILAEDQSEISNRFASSSYEKFESLSVDTGLGGVPLLRGCSARLQCRVVSRTAGGDHTIYVGQVCSIER